MNIAQIETNLYNLIATFNEEDFIFELLLSYGLPKASITRLRKGNLNLSKVEGDIAWKKKLYFREEQTEDLHLTISNISKELKHDERFVVVTDYTTLLAIDTKTNEGLDIDLKDLPKHYDFFLPWSGMEKAQHTTENPADVKAAERMAKLFDRIKADNPDDSPDFLHSLNVFLSRLLFCYFAEDTHIFEESQFTNAIASHTQTDGSDLDEYLDKLFTVLNSPEGKRRSINDTEVPDYLNAFPFVNGGLFRDKLSSPKFTRSSRAALLEGGDQNWAAINPDIFGSMFQASVSLDQRGHLGQHYTSVPNIMKVIEPLFLNELYEELEKATSTSSMTEKKKKLAALLNRIHNLKIFDPACGSGNFLIIAYKELRILEMKIFKEGQMMALSGIELSQFYGIEIDDFAGEIAKLALWLAEHQMNVEFFREFGRTNPTLPLKEAGHIVQGNACRLDWEEVCPKKEGDEIYILGNPPYLGARIQDETHKADMDIALSSFPKYRDLDYIAIWFYKAAYYIKGFDSKCAFVTTNSISQGLQVGLLWPNIFYHGIEIYFAHTSFRWTNSARNNAGVTVAIIGLTNVCNKQKTIYSNGRVKHVDKINAYLTDGSKVIVQRRSKPLSNFEEMSFGNMPNDGGGLILSEQEKDKLLSESEEAKVYLKKFIGAQEFIRGQVRYCLWIKDDEKDNAKTIPFIEKCIEKTRSHRLNSNDSGTNRLAERSHQFRDTKTPLKNQIIIPSVSSERREYIPTGFLADDTVISNSAQVIYDAEPWLLGVLNSKIHMVWLRAIGGKLKTDYRYSKDVVYNTFPFPPISTQRKNEITQATFRILEEREKHSDKTLAELYDPDKMPEGLREAHRQNDEIVEKCYRSRPFESDEERLEYLFKLYEKMIEEEKQRDTLFEKEKKTRKKRK